MFLVELCVTFQFLLQEIILEESMMFVMWKRSTEWELGEEGSCWWGEAEE